MIEKDEQEGGTRFELHRKCRIEQYFNIADRVCANEAALRVWSFCADWNWVSNNVVGRASIDRY